MTYVITNWQKTVHYGDACLFQEPLKSQPLPPIGSNIMHNRPVSQSNQNGVSTSHFYSELPTRSLQQLNHSDTNIYKSGTSNFSEATSNMLNMSADNQHLLSFQPNPMQHMSYSQPQQQQNPQGSMPVVSMSRLNPKAPDFSSSMHTMQSKNTQMFNGYVTMLNIIMW